MKPENKLMGTKFGKLTVLGEYQPGKKAIKIPNYFAARVYPSVLCECECDNPPAQKYLRKNVTDNLGSYIYNDLDRINTSKEYDLDNVIPCCGVCNFMRHTLSMQDFYKQIDKIMRCHLLLNNA